VARERVEAFIRGDDNETLAGDPARKASRKTAKAAANVS
jgi:hypothetical protein